MALYFIRQSDGIPIEVLGHSSTNSHTGLLSRAQMTRRNEGTADRAELEQALDQAQRTVPPPPEPPRPPPEHGGITALLRSRAEAARATPGSRVQIDEDDLRQPLLGKNESHASEKDGHASEKEHEAGISEINAEPNESGSRDHSDPRESAAAALPISTPVRHVAEQLDVPVAGSSRAEHSDLPTSSKAIEEEEETAGEQGTADEQGGEKDSAPMAQRLLGRMEAAALNVAGRVGMEKPASKVVGIFNKLTGQVRGEKDCSCAGNACRLVKLAMHA